MTRWLHTEHCPRSLRGWQLGSQDASHLLFFVTIEILSKYLEECFTSVWAPATVKLAQSHRHIHYYTEMNPWQKILKCQLVDLVRLTWVRGSNVFIPFPAQGPSHSVSKSENHDELFRPVEIAKKNPTVRKLCKIFRKSCLLSVWVAPLMFPTLLAVHTNVSNKVWRMFG